MRAGPTEPTKPDRAGPSCASRTDGTNESRPLRAISCEQDRRNQRNQTFQGHPVRAGPTEPPKSDLSGPSCASRTDGTNETRPFRASLCEQDRRNQRNQTIQGHYIYIYICRTTRTTVGWLAVCLVDTAHGRLARRRNCL